MARHVVPPMLKFGEIIVSSVPPSVAVVAAAPVMGLSHKLFLFLSYNGSSILLPRSFCTFSFLSLLCVLSFSSLSHVVYFYSDSFVLICNIAALLLSLSFSSPSQSFYQRCGKACLKSKLCFTFEGIILYKE